MSTQHFSVEGQEKGACTWFQCPVSDVLPFGDHSRHPYPGQCRYYLMCLRDGSVKIGGCAEGTAFNPTTKNCEPEATVTQCG